MYKRESRQKEEDDCLTIESAKTRVTILKSIRVIWYDATYQVINKNSSIFDIDIDRY